MSHTPRIALTLLACALAGCGDSAAPSPDTGPTGLEDGDKCNDKAQCKSGICVDGVCCATACVGSCISCRVPGSLGKCANVPDGDDLRSDCSGEGKCGGSCDGNKACRYPGASTECDAKCAASGAGEDKITRSFCDGAGACVAKGTDDSCGGYACKSGACETSCDANTNPCTGVFQCVNNQCKANLPPGTPCGSNNNACQSGFCVDGVCCKSACDGACESCEASSGNCVPAAAGTDPDNDCEVSGQPAACKSSCDGSGACNWNSDICNQACDGNATDPGVNVFSCNQGVCPTTPSSTQSCNFAKCSNNQCLGGCTDKNDCVSGSLCDRTAAHADTNGRGSCVDPAKIQTVATTIQAAVSAAIAASKTHVRVPNNATPYTSGANITSGAITIIGDGSVTVRPSSGAAFSVTGGGLSMSLQNITVNQSPDVGVSCGSLGSQSTLVVVESKIASSAKEGVAGTKCDVTLRRNTINGNAGGGVSVSNGAFNIVNNVIIKNAVAPAVGGAKLDTPAVGSVFAYNTVSFNTVNSGGVSGVSCTGGGATLTNNIVWGNVVAGGGGQEIQGCTFTNSNIPGGTGSNIEQNPQFVDTATNNFSLKTSPLSPCINAGTATPTGATSIDINNTTRLKGPNTDMGAYEVQ